jgi:hypothetical protein
MNLANYISPDQRKQNAELRQQDSVKEYIAKKSRATTEITALLGRLREQDEANPRAKVVEVLKPVLVGASFRKNVISRRDYGINHVPTMGTGNHMRVTGLLRGWILGSLIDDGPSPERSSDRTAEWHGFKDGLILEDGRVSKHYFKNSDASACAVVHSSLVDVSDVASRRFVELLASKIDAV